MKILFALIILFFSAQVAAQLPAFDSDKVIKGLKIDTLTDDISRIRIEIYDVESDVVALSKYHAIEEHVYQKDGRIDSVHFLNSRTKSMNMSYFFDQKGRILGLRRYKKEAWFPIIDYSYNEELLTAEEQIRHRDSTTNFSTIIQ